MVGLLLVQHYSRPMARSRWCWILAVLVGCSACREAEVRSSEGPIAASPAETLSSPSAEDTPTRWPKKLVFAATPYFGVEKIRAEFEPMTKYLTDRLGLPVEFRFIETYNEMIAQMDGPNIHLAVLSPLSFVTAKEANPDLILLAMQIANGAPTYSAYIVARADRGFSTIADLEGKRFGFVDPQSTSGYLYPMAWMVSHGIEPESFFSDIVYAGDHEKLIEMVSQGKVDGGATSSSAYRIARLENPSIEAISILAKTGRIPYDAVVASPGLDPVLVAKIREAILGLSTRLAEGRRVLGGPTNSNGFVPADTSLYEEVRKAQKALEKN